MKEYKTIIWDFNGTLIDDVYAALGAVNDMLIKRNQPTIDIVRYRKEVDTPISRFYDNVFIPGTLDFKDAVVEFDSGYEKYLSTNPLMPGVRDILVSFKSLGKRMIIVSASNIDKITRRLIDLDIYGYFDTVLARSDYMAADKEYLAKEYFDTHDLSPDSAVVIGDCVADWQMSQSLGCDCILNTRGHQGRAEFAQTDAVIIDDFAELKNYIS